MVGNRKLFQDLFAIAEDNQVPLAEIAETTLHKMSPREQKVINSCAKRLIERVKRASPKIQMGRGTALITIMAVGAYIDWVEENAYSR